MIRFKTEYTNRPGPAFCKSGSRYKSEYQEVVNDDGEFDLKCVGQVDQYEMIQAAKPLGIYEILDQSGVDVNALKGQIEIDEVSVVDFVSMPRTLAEAQQLLIRGQRAYDELPIEVRDQYKSPIDFVNSLQDGSYKSRLAQFLPKQPEVIDEPKE